MKDVSQGGFPVQYPPNRLANPAPPPARKVPSVSFSVKVLSSPVFVLSCLVLSCPVLSCLVLSWLDFPAQLGPKLGPQIHQNPEKWSPGGVPMLTSFLDRFLIDFGNPRPSKIIKFIQEP